MATINPQIQICAQTRPCWVDGRRALFHRWTDSARPVKPYGMEDDDTADRFQVWNVHGLVEYEDGTMARVWPNMIQFADGGDFAEYDWNRMEAERDNLPFTCAADPDPEPKPGPVVRRCRTCAHTMCDVLEEPCKSCIDESNWTPAGGPGHGDN